MKIKFRDINTKLSMRIVTCFPECVSWSSTIATKSTKNGIITELNSASMRGAKYSGKYVVKLLPPRMPLLIQLAMGLAMSNRVSGVTSRTHTMKSTK